MYPELSGTIDDEEENCRGGFEAPVRNYNAKGEIKLNLISEGKLLSGQLSVYRASQKAHFTIDEVAVQLESDASNVLKELYGARASEIRALRVGVFPGRIFCLVDDCVIDDKGTKHRAHADILICENLTANGLKSGDQLLNEIRNKLYLLSKQRVVWPAP